MTEPISKYHAVAPEQVAELRDGVNVLNRILLSVFKDPDVALRQQSQEPVAWQCICHGPVYASAICATEQEVEDCKNAWDHCAIYPLYTHPAADITDERILELAEQADKEADDKLLCVGEFHPDWNDVRDIWFARAILKEVQGK